MNYIDGVVLNILKATFFSKEAPIQMSIIVRQTYAYLETDLKEVFQNQEDVKVIIDRRYGRRRMKNEPFIVEHRISDRRKPKEPLIDVVISNVS
jgi:hypothetical protein